MPDHTRTPFDCIRIPRKLTGAVMLAWLTLGATASGAAAPVTVVVVQGDRVRAVDITSGVELWNSRTPFALSLVQVIPDHEGGVVLAYGSLGTVAFDGGSGDLLWSRSAARPLAWVTDVYGQAYTNRLSYPHGPPDLGGSESPDVLLTLSRNWNYTSWLVDSRTGEHIWSRTDTSFEESNAIQMYPTVSGSYDVIFSLATFGVEGKLVRVDGNTGSGIVWERDFIHRHGIPVPDVNGDNEYDLFAEPSYYSPEVIMLDGATGADIWRLTLPAYDIVTSPQVLRGAHGIDVIVSAQNGPIQRYRGSDGTVLWTSSHHCPYAFVQGLLRMGLGEYSVPAMCARPFAYFLIDADNGDPLWTEDIVVDHGHGVAGAGIGVPDMTGDLNDDLLLQVYGPSVSEFRLYDGISGQEIDGFTSLQGDAIACLSTITPRDCNANGVPDDCDVTCDYPGGPCDVAGCGTASDCNANWVPDECEPQEDCNGNGIQDICDIASGLSGDCDDNGVPDECQPQDDCNNNGILDFCDIAQGTSDDCNHNGIPDGCDLASGTSGDCNTNGVPDDCEPQADCNHNGIQDICDIASGGEDDCNANAIPDACEPNADCNGNGIQDICDIAVGTSADCDDDDVPDECQPQDDCNGNGILDFCEIAQGGIKDCNANAIPDECESFDTATVLYVARQAAGEGTGLNWQDALTDLEHALCLAEAYPEIREIRVAAGTYVPSREVIPGNPRSATFRLVDGVRLLGGFPPEGGGEDDRRPAVHETILSGDLAGDDELTSTGHIENCYHVVTGRDTVSAILDGFVITRGNANAPTQGSQDTFGGGMYNRDAVDLVITHCVFRRNRAHQGGAALVFDYGSGSSVINCRFESNVAGLRGGAVFISAHPAALINCIFVGNRTPGLGGAVYANSDVLITNSTFTGNHAAANGGALYMHAVNKSVSIHNTIIWRNVAPLGPQIALNRDGDLAIESCNIQGGRESIHTPLTSQWTINWGTGNMDIDPMLSPDGHLKTGSPCINAGDDSLLPPDTADLDGDGDTMEPIPFDINGEDRVAMSAVDIGADEFIDNDMDGLPNWWEARYTHSMTGADPGRDLDADLLTNLQEYEEYGSNPVASPLRVHSSSGAGNENGLEAGQPHPGSKRTLQAALDAAADGDTIIAGPGVYSGPGNCGLDFHGRSVILRTSPAHAETIIDCGHPGNVVDPDSLGGMSPALQGFTIANDPAASGSPFSLTETTFLLADIDLSEPSGASEQVLVDLAAPVFKGLRIRAGAGNDAGWMTRNSIYLAPSDEGPGLTLESGTLKSSSNWFVGPGGLEIGPDARLHIARMLGSTPTVIRSNISGTGGILIDAGERLIIGGDAIVDLGGEGLCNPDPFYPTGGTVIVEGSLLLEDRASLRNTHVEVKLAEFGEGSDVADNNIVLLEASTGFGGEFFVEPGTTVYCNTIVSEGDRYLDLDPDPDNRNWNISENHIYVRIKEGIHGAPGTVFELRTEDLDCTEPCGSGAFSLMASPGYSSTWALEELELFADAKLNLTNRQGFVFQDPSIGTPETVYVRKLILHPNAVLNTAFQRLYYQQLVDQDGIAIDPGEPHPNNSRIVDQPLLGFSLGTIRMDDDLEFDVRIQKRRFDPSEAPPQPEGVIARVPDPITGIGGVMKMETQQAGSVAAKGAFARAGDEDITITFMYLFREVTPRTRLNIYLSDDSHIGRRVFKVAELSPPPDSMRGGVGSSEFALFRGHFPRVVPGLYELNFTRGTYVEIELTGTDSRVLVDDFDPKVVCIGVCGDFDGDVGTTPADYLILLGESGRSVSSEKFCLDFVDDGYIDLADLIMMDIAYNADSGVCVGWQESTESQEAGAAVRPEQASPASALGLTIVAKPNDPADSDLQDDLLYRVNADTGASGAGTTLICPDQTDCTRGVSRLVSDAAGTQYVVHAVHGLIRMDDGVVLIEPGTRPWQGRTVSIGLDGSGTLPLLDAAFAADELDPSSVYVLPVVVRVPEAGTIPEHTYHAAARLRLGATGSDYTLEAVFGIDPIGDDPNECANCMPSVPGGSCIPLCDLTNVREIEVDSVGNVLVIAASIYNDNDWVMIYHEQAAHPGFEVLRANLHDLLAGAGYPPPRSPGAMHLSRAEPGTLYLSPQVDSGQGLVSRIYRFTYHTSQLSLTWDGVVEVDGAPDALPAICDQPEVSCTDYFSNISAIQETERGELLAIGHTAPRFPEGDKFVTDFVNRMFTTPTLTTLPAGVLWSRTPAAPSVVHGRMISGSDIAFPISALYKAPHPADFDADGDVDQADFQAFEACASGPGVPIASGCEGKDFDKDNDVDQSDFAVLQKGFSGENN